MKSDVPKGQRKKGRTVNVAWILTIFALTIAISGIFSRKNQAAVIIRYKIPSVRHNAAHKVFFFLPDFFYFFF